MNQETLPEKKCRVFEGFMANLLISCADMAKDREVSFNTPAGMRTEYVRKAVLSEDFRIRGLVTQYARLGDLKFWGLLDQDGRWWHQGIYRLTDKARRFILGEISLPRYIYTRKKEVVEQEGEITFREAVGKDWNRLQDWLRQWRGTPIREEQLALFGGR